MVWRCVNSVRAHFSSSSSLSSSSCRASQTVRTASLLLPLPFLPFLPSPAVLLPSPNRALTKEPVPVTPTRTRRGHQVIMSLHLKTRRRRRRRGTRGGRSRANGRVPPLLSLGVLVIEQGLRVDGEVSWDGLLLVLVLVRVGVRGVWYTSHTSSYAYRSLLGVVLRRRSGRVRRRRRHLRGVGLGVGVSVLVRV